MTKTRTTTILAGMALIASAASAQNSAGTTPPPAAPGIIPPPTISGGGCITGFVGDTTIAGGWTAFEAASGATMDVIISPYADFDQVTSIPTSCGDLGLNPACERRTVGVSWGTWSHGYTGELFWTQGSTTLTMDTPDNTTAYDFYSEPNPFALQNYTVTANGSDASTTQVNYMADGSSGAVHAGFYSGGCTITSIDMVVDADFAIAEMRISCGPGAPGSNYCTSVANSTGSAAVMSGSGSGDVAGADLALTAGPVPNQPYIFFHGANQIQIPFGNGGFLCAGGGIVRSTPAVAAGNQATITYDNDVDFAAYAGMTRNFQCWFRDPAAGGDNFNTSDGYAVGIN